MKNEMTRNRNNTGMATPSAEAVRHAMQAQAAASSGMATEGGSLLRFQQQETDQWVVGINGEIVDTGKKYIVEGLSIASGFVCWKGGRPVDEKLKTLDDFLHQDVPVRIEDLPDHGPYATDREGKQLSTEGWREQAAARVKPADADPEEDAWMYKPGSYSGRKALLTLGQRVLGEALLRHPDFPNPIVKLSSDQYFNKTYKKEIYTPEIRVVGWADENGNVMMEGERVSLTEENQSLDGML